MSRPLLLDAAAAVFWLHMAVIAFNIGGLVVIPLGAWRGWRFVRILWWRALHLGALGLVALQAVLGRACFLTDWEADLLAEAGRPASTAPLIQRWVASLVYWDLPIWLFAVLYVAVGLFTLLLWWWVPPRQRG